MLINSWHIESTYQMVSSISMFLFNRIRTHIHITISSTCYNWSYDIIMNIYFIYSLFWLREYLIDFRSKICIKICVSRSQNCTNGITQSTWMAVPIEIEIASVSCIRNNTVCICEFAFFELIILNNVLSGFKDNSGIAIFRFNVSLLYSSSKKERERH